MKSTDLSSFTRPENIIYEELLRCHRYLSTERIIRSRTALGEDDFVRAIDGLIERGIVNEREYTKGPVTKKVYKLNFSR